MTQIFFFLFFFLREDTPPLYSREIWLFSPFNARIKPLYLFHVASNDIQNTSLYTFEHAKAVLQYARRCKEVYSHHTVCFQAHLFQHLTLLLLQADRKSIASDFHATGLGAFWSNVAFNYLIQKGSRTSQALWTDPAKMSHKSALALLTLYSSSNKFFTIWALQWFLYLC